MSIDVESRTVLSFKLDCSVNNVPTSYSAAPGSRILTGVRYSTGIEFLNYTTHDLYVNFYDGDDTTIPTRDQMYIPNAGGGDFASKTRDNVKLAANIYVRSVDGSPITTGHIVVEVW